MIQESLLYDNGLPSDIITLINLPLLSFHLEDNTQRNELALYLHNVKLSKLGEEFVASLIESRQNDTVKYIIAQKAVLEAMSKNLYKLVRREKVTPECITHEALPYLRTVDPALLSSGRDVATGLPFIVTIGNYQIKDINGREYYAFIGNTSDPYDVRLAIRTRYPRKVFNTDTMNVFSKDGTARKLSEFVNSPLIRVTKFQQVRDYFVIDDYELLDD